MKPDDLMMTDERYGKAWISFSSNWSENTSWHMLFIYCYGYFSHLAREIILYQIFLKIINKLPTTFYYLGTTYTIYW